MEFKMNEVNVEAIEVLEETDTPAFGLGCGVGCFGIFCFG